MEELLLSLLLYGQIMLGGTEIYFEKRYMGYARPKVLIQWQINTEIYEYIGSIKVGEELKPLFTFRMEEI